MLLCFVQSLKHTKNVYDLQAVIYNETDLENGVWNLSQYGTHQKTFNHKNTRLHLTESCSFICRRQKHIIGLTSNKYDQSNCINWFVKPCKCELKMYLSAHQIVLNCITVYTLTTLLETWVCQHQFYSAYVLFVTFISPLLYGRYGLAWLFSYWISIHKKN